MPRSPISDRSGARGDRSQGKLFLSGRQAALHRLTGSLGKRLAADNVTVNAIAPGFFPSNITATDDPEMLERMIGMVPRHRLGTPEHIGSTVVYLASRAASFVTGAVIPPEGGMAL